MTAPRSSLLACLALCLAAFAAAPAAAAPDKEQLVGVWEGPKEGDKQLIWEFTKDNKLKMTVKEGFSASGTTSPYTLNGDTISSAGESFKIKSLDDKELVVTQGNKTLKFTNSSWPCRCS